MLAVLFLKGPTMLSRFPICFVLLLGLLANPGAASPLPPDSLATVASSDGTLVATVDNGSADRDLACLVTVDGRKLFRFTSLGLAADGIDLGLAPRLAGKPSAPRTIDVSCPWQGARSTLRNHARKLVVPLQSSERNFNLIVRAYDDRVALRYNLGAHELSITSESTSWIRPFAGAQAWFAHVKDYESVHNFPPGPPYQCCNLSLLPSPPSPAAST